MTKNLLFRKAFLRAGFFKQFLIFKSYEEYKSNKTQQRFNNLLRNSRNLDIGSFVKTIYHPQIQMVLLKH